MDDGKILRECLLDRHVYRLPDGTTIEAKPLGYIDALELIRLRAIAETARGPTDVADGELTADEAIHEIGVRFPVAIDVSPERFRGITLVEMMDVLQDFFMYRRPTSTRSSPNGAGENSERPATPTSSSTTPPSTVDSR